MSNINSIPPYSVSNLQDLVDAIGITQFTSEKNWHHTIAGILIQGGFLQSVGSGVTLVVPFNVGFPKQVLGVWPQPIGTSLLGHSINNITTAQFELVNDAVVRDFYWFAIGV